MTALPEQPWTSIDNAPAPSPERCRFCSDLIPEGRRAALPGVDTCIECQRDIERRSTFDWGMAE